MPDPDFLTEIIQTTSIHVNVPGAFDITVIDQIADNVVSLEIVMIPVEIDGDGPPDMRLELMDGDLFVATNDGLLGTRLRTAYGVPLTSNALTFQIPQTANRLFGFSLNGIDYIECVALTPGSGIVTFTPQGSGGYAPQSGDFLLITYSE